MTPQKEMRVLIVEDDFMVRETIRQEVESLAYTVAGEALDGRQAVEMTQSLDPDVVLMDIEMPDMNGLEATRHIYETCPTPVIMLTAYDTPELVEQAGLAGAGAYLVKMPKAQEIERAVTIATARFDDMMELRHLNAELRAYSEELQARNEQLQAALDKVKLLSGLLPICSSCKKIRDDEGYWQEVEVYIWNHSEAKFSHGLCPDCLEEFLPDSDTESDELDQSRQDILDVLEKLKWANLEEISANLGLPESEVLSRLQDMVASGQIRQLDVDREVFYKLS